jgi:predicted enzyme related to lactoylglutathione lyase
MSGRSDYAPGEFCWVDLATTDVDAAAALYSELLGWAFEPAPGPPELTGGYGFFTRDGKMMAGLGRVMNEGQPPAWSSYVAVADVDATAAKVREAGGQVYMGPIDLPNESGRLAVVADTTGAVLGIIELRKHTGAQVVNEPGAWTWNQLATPSAAASRDFYGQVLGWELTQAEGVPADLPYFMWQVEGQRWPEGLAGAMVMGDAFPPDTPSHWMAFFAVPEIGAAVDTVARHGGTLQMGPQKVPSGSFAVMIDAQGAPFSVVEPHYPEPR